MPAAVLLNSDDPLFVFENMMAHRQYFPVMSELSGFSVLPYELDPASETQVPASMWNLSHQQAHNDFNSDLPDTNNDGYSITVVTPPVATGTGTITGTTLNVTGVQHSILIGSTVSGTGVPAATTVVSQQSGTPPGGAGTYTVSKSATVATTALSFTHPPYQQANVLSGGSFGIPQGQSLLEGSGLTAESRSWFTFANHQEHFIANEAILPYPATAPTTAGTPPGQATASNPWWWATRAPLKYPFW